MIHSPQHRTNPTGAPAACVSPPGGSRDISSLLLYHHLQYCAKLFMYIGTYPRQQQLCFRKSKAVTAGAEGLAYHFDGILEMSITQKAVSRTGSRFFEALYFFSFSTSSTYSDISPQRFHRAFAGEKRPREDQNKKENAASEDRSPKNFLSDCGFHGRLLSAVFIPPCNSILHQFVTFVKQKAGKKSRHKG